MLVLELAPWWVVGTSSWNAVEIPLDLSFEWDPETSVRHECERMCDRGIYRQRKNILVQRIVIFMSLEVFLVHE